MRRETVAALEERHPPLRIGFVSDIHIGPTTPDRLLNRAFGLLAEARLDVLALGGDYVFLDITRDKASRLARLVEAVPAPTKVAVLGNHDLWSEHELFEAALAEVGVSVLVNDAVELDGPHAGVAILGIDEPYTGDANLAEARAQVPGAEVLLALCHSPDCVPQVEGSPVRLLLAGHTHGGHIALPGPTPIVVPGPYGRRYPFGRHRLAGGATLIVSRGVGGVEVPMRLFAPPDVLVVDVVARPAGPGDGG